MLIQIMARQSNYQKKKCQPCLSDRSQQESSTSVSFFLYPPPITYTAVEAALHMTTATYTLCQCLQKDCWLRLSSRIIGLYSILLRKTFLISANKFKCTTIYITKILIIGGIFSQQNAHIFVETFATSDFGKRAAKNWFMVIMNISKDKHAIQFKYFRFNKLTVI